MCLFFNSKTFTNEDFHLLNKVPNRSECDPYSVSFQIFLLLYYSFIQTKPDKLGSVIHVGSVYQRVLTSKSYFYSGRCLPEVVKLQACSLTARGNHNQHTLIRVMRDTQAQAALQSSSRSSPTTSFPERPQIKLNLPSRSISDLTNTTKI